MKNMIKNILLFIIMGLTYYFIEVLWRGYSHISMFWLGGLCGYLVGQLNERFLTWQIPLWKQILYGEFIVLPLEFITGCIVNLWLGWNVWDYSNLPLNILGQSSALFAFIFAPVILLAIIVDDYYRYWFMNEEKPRYKLI